MAIQRVIASAIYSYSLQVTYNSIRREVVYTILTEFGIPMKVVWLIKMSLNERNSRVRVDKYLSVMLPIRNGLKQRHALLPIILNFFIKCH